MPISELLKNIWFFIAYSPHCFAKRKPRKTIKKTGQHIDHRPSPQNRPISKKSILADTVSKFTSNKTENGHFWKPARDLHGGPGTPQGHPENPRGPPRDAQDRPGTPRDTPGTPRGPPGPPRVPPRHPQRTPRHPPRPPRGLFSGVPRQISRICRSTPDIDHAVGFVSVSASESSGSAASAVKPFNNLAIFQKLPEPPKRSQYVINPRHKVN